MVSYNMTTKTNVTIPNTSNPPCEATVFPLISAAPLGIHIEISAPPLISAAPLNAVFIRIVTIFY